MEHKPAVAFIGLGAMGSRMARRLLAAGFPLAAYDVRPAASEALVKDGARQAETPRAVVEGADVVVLMVQNHTQAQAVLDGPHGALAGLADGSTIVVMATLPPDRVRDLEMLAATRQVGLLDAPVSGGTPGAESGTLSIMIGGAAEQLERCKPLLETLGSKIYHIGPNVGDGQSAKMVNQLLCGVHLAAAAEAMVLARKAGLDQAQMLEIVSNSSAASWMLQHRAGRMLTRSFDQVFSFLALLDKDMGIVMDGAQAVQAPTPLAAAARETFKAGAAMGLSTKDDSALIQVYERLAGL